jgi:hypothetical protein
MDVLGQVKPERIYIAADGPRADKTGEAKRCAEVRDYVIGQITWSCDVKTRFQDVNLGCGKHVSQAITWFFDQEEEGIILEDDCIPHSDFFTYCSALLEKYRHDEQIFTIGGNNFQPQPRGNGSYYFSAYGHIWGWATWRRAWVKYQFNMNSYSELLMRKRLRYYFKTLQEVDHWMHIFERMCNNPIDTWDYQWSFCQWYHGGLSIMPNINLVSNIGYGEDATHTVNYVEGILDRNAMPLGKLIHPTRKLIQRKADLNSFYTNFEKKKSGYFFLKLKEKMLFELNKLKGFLSLTR